MSTISLLFLAVFIATYDTLFLDLQSNYQKKSVSILCTLDTKTDSNNMLESWILINARFLYKVNQTNRILITNIPFSHNRYSIAIYSRTNTFQFLLHGINDIDIVPSYAKHSTYSSQAQLSRYNLVDYTQPFTTLSAPALSTYYTTINVNTAQAWQNVTHNLQQLHINNDAPTMESVIRASDNVTISDLNSKWNWTLNSTNVNIEPVQQMDTYYHQQPRRFGYYCLYTNPDSDTNIVPDCPNVTEIITEHAKMLYSSGIDFMVPDDTNLVGGISSVQSYVLQIKPNQNIFTVFNQLKDNGTNAPYLAFWNRATGTEWQINLDLYNNYSDLIYSAPTQNEKNTPMKKAYFINTNKGYVNETVIEQIQSNGGRNDVQIIYMWCNYNQSMLNHGYWTFFQPCTTMNGSAVIKTTSVQTAIDCNFQMTKNSSLGSQISATMSWNVASHGSLPFGSPTKLNGRTFQLIIKDCLKLKPDNVFFPSFNEHTSGQHIIPQSYGGNNTWSSGLYLDANRSIMFGDTFGADVNRAIEPTKESGNYYYLLFQSCARILRLHYFFGDLWRDGNISICNVQNEICCNNLTQYKNVWSLKSKNESDYVLSDNKTEVSEFTNGNYSEICAVLPYSNTTVFCQSNENLHNFEAHQGPFILYRDAMNPYEMIGSLSVTNISRIAIYRCIDNGIGAHFIANNGINCDGIPNSSVQYLLGYAAKSPSSAMGRRIMRCVDNKWVYYHVIGADCFPDHPPTAYSALLGYAL